MNADLRRIGKPRCILLYALASPDLSPAEANRAYNRLIADSSLPLVIFHDHFIGRSGGVALFFARSAEEREALQQLDQLPGWEAALHSLVFSTGPAGFDEQIAFTLRAYRGLDWEQVRQADRSS